MNTSVQDTFTRLQQEIFRMQGGKPNTDVSAGRVALGPVLEAFPDQRFPTAAVHECVTTSPASTAATTGFIAGVLGCLMKNNGPCIWISPDKILFPPGFSGFGLSPERLLLVNAKNKQDLAWTMETCLQMNSIAAVVCELPDLDFTISRRLQLAVEKSGVTGFVLRTNRNLHPTVCVSRWLVTPAASHHPKKLPGVTHPCWNINLLKVRGGRTGTWQLVWMDGHFQTVPSAMPAIAVQEQLRKIS